jgi:diadenosine tetraphosphate (Ap4A) HIT family hydrolase
VIHSTAIQNNGKRAWQSVDHVHFHVVPKPESEPDRGLVLTHESWPSYEEDETGYARDAERMRNIGREHDFPGVPDQDSSNYGI